MAGITASQRLQRSVLLAPVAVARVAATQVKEPEEQWMLRQARDVRASYVHEVLDRGGEERLAQIWLLRQPEAVRESYIREVLDTGDDPLG
jgi:hypothetical protein